MPHQVKVLRSGASLPDGNVYFTINQVVTLTDAQYASLSSTVFTSGELQDLGAVADPLAGVPFSTVTTKGDLIAGTGNATVARLGAGTDGKVLTADSTQTSGLSWTAPSGGATSPSPAYPLSGYGLVAATGSPENFGKNSAIVGDGYLWGARAYIPAGTAFSRLALLVVTGGTHSASSTPNKLVLWDDSGTVLDSTTDDSTLWTSAGWHIGTLSGGTQAAQGSGRFVYVGFLCGGFTGVSPSFIASSDGTGLETNPVDTRKRAAFRSGQTTAVTLTIAGGSGWTGTNYVPLIGVLT